MGYTTEVINNVCTGKSVEGDLGPFQFFAFGVSGGTVESFKAALWQEMVLLSLL